MARYVEAILPLPLPGTFTYLLPPELESAVRVGSRVYVPFGKKKYLTAIVEEIHSRPPQGYEVKPISLVLDEEPKVRPGQIRFWHWLADYYLCTPGDVYKAALPVGLRVDSETCVTRNDDFDYDTLPRPLTERQATVMMHVRDEKVSLSKLSAATRIEHVGPVVNQLLRLGCIEVYERAVEHYRPVKTLNVRFTIERGDEEGMRAMFDSVQRAQKQETMLVAYLNLSGWLLAGQPLKAVAKKDLLKASRCSAAVFKAMQDKGIFETYEVVSNRFNNTADSVTEPLATLSADQNRAIVEIKRGLKEKNVMLLHGVTGSGKTEIYTHLIDAVLRQGNQVLYLVPEISLTTQLTDRLRRVFGQRLLVYHSKFSDNERVDIWNKLLSSHEPMVVLGVRSSVFLPFAHLGLVIVDEEHESSYKQYDPAPRYNARDAAIVLATMHGAKTVLGSATPAIETYRKALDGKYGLVSLDSRYGDAVMPQVEIVDMRRQRREKRNDGIISEPLKLLTLDTLQRHRQVIMFQNRRGFAPMVVCEQCGWVPRCQRCDVSLVYHQHSEMLTCHYCGYTTPLPPVCPACGLPGVRSFGYGTERVTEELKEMLPGVRISRMDLDSTRNKNAYQDIINEFGSHKTDILVGTQMVTKGLDFAHVDVVGVINADTLLNFPDFRSDERAFNMLEQVAGRAGRRSGSGRVLIQTTSPSNPVLRHVQAHDYIAFYREQIADREAHFYPPFSKVIYIYLKHRDDRALDSLAIDYAASLTRIFGARVLGPEKPLVSRISNWNIRKIMLKVEVSASMKKVKDILRSVYEQYVASSPTMKTAQIYYDVDPV